MSGEERPGSARRTYRFPLKPRNPVPHGCAPPCTLREYEASHRSHCARGLAPLAPHSLRTR